MVVGGNSLVAGEEIDAVNAIVRACSALALIGFALFATVPQWADAANFSGTWTVRGTMGALNSNGVCTFRQSGNSLSGYCVSPGGRATAVGAVNGTKIAWQIHNTATNSRGLTGVGTSRGTLVSANVIQGTWTTSVQPGVGTFTATR
jgi:hypothetical protein